MADADALRGWTPATHRGPTPPIECRAVSLEFLERLLEELTPEMERSATSAAIEFLERQDWASAAATSADSSAGPPQLPVQSADATSQQFADAIFDLVTRSLSIAFDS